VSPDGRRLASDLDQLWLEPRDLETRNLYFGPGGSKLAPSPAVRYEVLAVDRGGFSPGYDVRDPGGTTWNVKVGREAQPEVVASRVLWAIGYHQPPVYLLPSWHLDDERQVQNPARFRRESPETDVVADWSWYENPFVETQAFKGLIVANLMLNNWDWKTSNNKIYEMANSNPPRRRVYVVRDLGASLGKISLSSFLRWTHLPFRQGSRNDIDDFEKQRFIERVEGERLRFYYRGANGLLVDSVTIHDVVWTSRLMARLSDEQWHDAFRAAGYGDAYRSRYIAKLKSKIAEGLALARP
jgi:hypothetical protein